MLVPQMADGFQGKVSSLRSLDESKGVSFHTFCHPEEQCVLLLLKNFGKHMPESVVREAPLGIHIQCFFQLRNCLRD